MTPQAAIAVAVGFMLAVVATPREWVWAFAAYAAILAIGYARTGVPLRRLRGMVVCLPFLVGALLMPFVATGPRVETLVGSLSVAGLWGAWNLMAKTLLGVATSLLLSGRYHPAQLVQGLRALHVPALLVDVAGFAVRYLEVVAGEARRMRIARASRGFEASNARGWPELARSVGTMYVRSYERGERVHQAMLSRGHGMELRDQSVG